MSTHTHPLGFSWWFSWYREQTLPSTKWGNFFACCLTLCAIC